MSNVRTLIQPAKNRTSNLLSADEIKKEELNILLAFKELCNSLNLKYTLIGGTLLGAIRHQGFIPWDDDIDVGMPRYDYMKMIDFIHHNHSLKRLELEDIYLVPLEESTFVKLVSTKVHVQERFNQNPGHLWIDIMPIDGLPDSAAATQKLYRRVTFYRKILSMSYANPHEGTTFLRKIVKRCFQSIDRNHWLGKKAMHKINRIAKENPYGSTGYVGALTNGLYGAGERMPIKGYEDTVEVTFEGERFKAMSCWDSYLTGIYGDYMTLPPVEKRVNHQMKAWRE
ncbi:LicD family protein [Parascardovia denticolens]